MATRNNISEAGGIFLSVRGFTLIELMVVIIILGSLAMWVAPKIMSRPEQAKQVMLFEEFVAARLDPEGGGFDLPLAPLPGGQASCLAARFACMRKTNGKLCWHLMQLPRCRQ